MTKSQAQFMIVGVVGTILSALLILSFLQFTSDNIVSSVDDEICKTYIQSKSLTAVKVGEFFLGELETRCKKDEIKFNDADTQDEVFQKVAGTMARCWNRYDEGKSDFMSNINTNGNWCFTCAKLEGDSDGEEYEYSDFIGFLEENHIDEDEDKKLYSEYVHVKYADATSGEMQEIKADLDEILTGEDGDDPTMRTFKFLLTNQYEYVQDQRLKKIDTTQDSYVVFRYDIPQKDTDDVILDTVLLTGASAVGGIAASAIIEGAIWAGASAITCSAAVLTSWTGVGAVVFGTMCASSVATTVAKVGGNIVSGVKSLGKVARLANKISSKIKSTKYSRATLELLEIRDKVALGIPDELIALGDKLLTSSDELLQASGKSLKDLGEFAKKHNFDNVHEITDDKIADLIRRDGRNIANLKDLINKKSAKALRVQTKKSNRLQRQLENNRESLTNIENRLEELENFENSAGKILDDVDNGLIDIFEAQAKLKTDTGLSISDYLRSLPVVIGATTGALIGPSLFDNPNQHVDILTQEQYYRLCGTEPNI